MGDSVMQWLLEDENPAVKYRTMIEIGGESLQADEVRKTYDLIWHTKEVRKVFAKQNEQRRWETKDYGVHTSLRYLTACAECGLQKDERLDRAVEDAIQQLQPDVNDLGVPDTLGCANGLVLRALVMLGYHEHPDVRELLAYYTSTQLYDGGFNCRRLLNKKPGRKSCYKASVAALLLYAACERKNILPDNKDKLVSYFLRRDVFYSSDKQKLILDGREGWRAVDNFFPAEPMRFGMPLIVSSLTALGAGKQEALTKAWEFLHAKKNENGRMLLEGTLTKQPCSFGKTGKENKWITFYTMLAEKERACE